MNRFFFILLCASAGLAGWGGMAWRQEAAAPGKPAAAPSLPPPAAAKAPAISRTADALQLARSLDATAADSLAKLLALPPGAARDLAVALYNSRARAATLARQKTDDAPTAAVPFNPFADLPPDAEAVTLWFEDLKNRMLSGVQPRDPSREEDPFASSPSDDPTEVLSMDALSEISRWAALDPAAASETILKMPATELRTAAVDAAAEVMAQSDPQAAWDLALKSGEQKLGEGAARAWLAQIGRMSDFNTNPARGLSPTQQSHLAVALRQLLSPEEGVSHGKLTPQEMSALTLAGPSLAPGADQDELLRLMAERDPMGLLFATGGGNIFVPEYPAHAQSHAQFLVEQALAEPDKVLAAITSTDTDSFNPAAAPAVLNAAAPRLLPQLAASGHLAEAVQILPRITDSSARRETLAKLLPQWMDADPAAARAAFNAAPFTALERERWQQHPSFLLNPEREGASP